MRPILKVAVTAILMVIAGQLAVAQAAAADDAPHALPASIVTLLAQPASKRAQQVLVSGFLSLDFEGDALYLHKEDYLEGLTPNAISLSLTPEEEKKYKGLAGSYVMIEASFIKRRNSGEIFTGSLFNIRDIRRTLSRH